VFSKDSGRQEGSITIKEKRKRGSWSEKAVSGEAVGRRNTGTANLEKKKINTKTEGRHERAYERSEK